MKEQTIELEAKRLIEVYMYISIESLKTSIENCSENDFDYWKSRYRTAKANAINCCDEILRCLTICCEQLSMRHNAISDVLGDRYKYYSQVKQAIKDFEI